MLQHAIHILFLLVLVLGSGGCEKATPPVQPTTPSAVGEEMDIQKFWKIIENSRQHADGGPDTQLVALRKSLEQLSPEDVVAFSLHFDSCDVQAYRWDLWAAAFVIHGGCSDDTFQDFRASLICRGRTVFERTLANPDSLVDLNMGKFNDELFFEGFQYLPAQIYKQKTSNGLPARKTPFPSDPVGTEWGEEDLRKICPKLWAKFGD